MLMMLGVSSLQSCTLYRIKAVIHPNGTTYYFPQKRFLISEWQGVRTYNGDYTLDWARQVIENDKKSDGVRIKYIK